MNDDLIRLQLSEALLRGGGTHDLDEHIVPLLKSGQAQWWEKGDGVVITELRLFPRFSAVNYWLVAGNMNDCRALQPDINDWARANGATRATAVGRKGWERILPQDGWKITGTCFGRDLRS